jgi:hypothetical protein
MIISNAAVAPTMSGVGETAKATIKASSRLFKFFSDMVYSDKFVAIWRELVANGVDSHVVAGNTDKAVIVTLPTTFTPYAKVRDFGTGMSREFLMTNFMAYTDASTKEASNELIGGFGIGSKAPLAYTEQFAIHSYQSGKLNIYSVFKDDEDCPAIAHLSEQDTNEPDGIEISFPVEQADITKFKEAAFQCLNYFNPLPILRNSAEQLKSPDYSVRTESWGFRRGQTTSQIVQGGVAYPISPDSVPRNLHEILGFGIDFFVPIGSVSISLSRESLSYDERTLRVLGSLCEGIRPKIQEHVNKMFEGYTSKWEAIKAYVETVRGNTPAGRLVESLAHYKGEKLQRYIDPVMSDKVLCAFISSSRWSKMGSNSWTTSRTNPPASAWIGRISPSDIQHIIIDDGPNKPMLRIRRFLEGVDSKDGVMFVRKRPDRVAMGAEPAFINDLKWDDFIKELGNPPFVYLSTIEPAVVTRGQGSARLEKIRGYEAPRVNAKFIDTLPVTGGYYIEMENFTIKGITSEEIKALDKGDKPLYYFNKGDFEKIKNKPEWISAKSKVDEQLKTYAREHKYARLAEAISQIARSSAFSSISRGLGPRLIDLLGQEKFACPKRGPLAQFNTLYQAAKPDLTDKDKATRSLLKINPEKQKAALEALIEAIKIKYPELDLMLKTHYVAANMVPVYNKLVS